MSAPLPAQDRLVPSAAWQPWQPTPSDPWSRKWAAHLYRRAGFGASRAELSAAEQQGYEATLQRILQGGSEAADIQKSLTDLGEIVVTQDEDGLELRQWWVYAMLGSAHPLREKMTLFWHNHFATSLAKVRRAESMFRQNCLFREQALGKFGPFLQAVSKDEAMLIWLDSNNNVKGKPNENYARELMELFSLGVGNYTEKDIRDAARAFTGWQARNDRYYFDAALHDDGVKTVLGRGGNWDGTDVVRIVLEQPAAARFLVRKLYGYFISENASPPDAFLEPLCRLYRDSGYDTALLVKTMLSSRHFYSPHAFRQRVKSPVEYVLGAARGVYGLFDESSPRYRPLPHQVLVPRIDAMGQVLFAPPNVKGWPGGRAWLNTSTMLERDNFAASLAMGTLWSRADTTADAIPAAYDPARVLEEDRATEPAAIAGILIDTHVPGGVRPEARAKLEAFLGEGKPTGKALARRVRESVLAIMTMPEYHLA
jgi:uncharacterized protein (DUF1800 family)